MTDLASIRAARAPAGRWTERLIELAGVWKHEADTGVRREALEEIWLLMITALCALLRSSARKYGQGGGLEIRDLAVDKSLELAQKLMRGQWDPTTMSSSQLYAFLSTVARNGVVDHVRSDRARAEGLRALATETRVSPEKASTRDSAERALHRVKFREALAECAERLTPRARRVWFLRVFYDLPSKLIAADEEIRMSSPTIDVSVSRSKAAIRKCLRKHGFTAEALPPGTFAVLWAAIETIRDRRERMGG